ncbi:MAG: lipase family protein [Rhodocyclaceae bacterium]|nr:lipase family protein [Rhodocyclaceae bacterium]
MTDSQTLTCRMLCAAECAYGIQPDQPFTPRQPWYDAVGWLDAPVPVVAGLEQIDAALIGANGDGIVLAFRGTLPPTPPLSLSIVLDWLQDFLAVPVPAAGFPGRIHDGFRIALTRLWPQILAQINELRARHPAAPIYVTGHSKGGALASLGAWRLRQETGLTAAQVIAFASAHAGNRDFVAAYNPVLTQTRFENYLDLVPFMPPGLNLPGFVRKIPDLAPLFDKTGDWDYEPAGTLQYITQEGAVVSDKTGLEMLRVAQIVEKLATHQADEVALAHSLVGYALGYCRGACGADLCGGQPGN